MDWEEVIVPEKTPLFFIDKNLMINAKCTKTNFG